MSWVEIGPHRLYCGDVRDVADELAGVADLLVTDAPYMLTSGGKNTSEMGGMFAAGRYNNSGKLMDMISWKEVAEISYGLLKKDADAYFFANDKNVWEANAETRRAGFKFHNLLVWQKNNAVANRWYMKHLEFVLYMYRGKAKRINNAGSKQLVFAANTKECGHPTGKPCELLRVYVENSSQAGQVVIDPFMGRGSLAVACALTGRRFIGVEIDREHFDAACARLERVVREVADATAA